MISRTDFDHLIGVDAELDDFPLRFDRSLGEVPALRLGGVLHLGEAGTELKRGVAVLFFGHVGNDLTAVEPQDRHRHLLSRIGVDAGHAQLLCDHT